MIAVFDLYLIYFKFKKLFLMKNFIVIVSKTVFECFQKLKYL